LDSYGVDELVVDFNHGRSLDEGRDSFLFDTELSMNGTDESQCEYQKLQAGDEAWDVILEHGCGNGSGHGEALAEMLFELKKATDGDPESRWASDTLLDGIRSAYLHTNAHKLAFDLYLLSLERHLNPQDEPEILLEAAIERGRKETKRAQARERRTSTQRAKRKSAEAREDESVQ
jgi:hypothetical protein